MNIPALAGRAAARRAESETGQPYAQSNLGRIKGPTAQKVFFDVHPARHAGLVFGQKAQIQ